MIFCGIFGRVGVCVRGSSGNGGRGASGGMGNNRMGGETTCVKVAEKYPGIIANGSGGFVSAVFIK